MNFFNYHAFWIMLWSRFEKEENGGQIGNSTTQKPSPMLAIIWYQTIENWKWNVKWLSSYCELYDNNFRFTFARRFIIYYQTKNNGLTLHCTFLISIFQESESSSISTHELPTRMDVPTLYWKQGISWKKRTFTCALNLLKALRLLDLTKQRCFVV